MKKFLTTAYITGFMFFMPLAASAAGCTTPSAGSGGFQFTNPLCSDTICGALKLLLQVLLTLGLPIAVLFLVYAGFRFIWARGDVAGMKSAKENLWYTILGISIFIGAWLLGQVIANTLNDVATQSGNPNAQIGACQ